MSWRLAKALEELRGEVNARWPNRDKSSDGSIGDTSHAARKSDHNPNAAGVVRAIDVDADGIPAAWFAEHVRKRGAGGDGRLTPGGYVIFNKRIASDVGGWVWRTYTGTNPHQAHVHVSCTTSASGYDDSGDWGVGSGKVEVKTAKKKLGLPKVKRGSRVLEVSSPRMSGSDVRYVQRRIGAEPDGFYGPDTEEFVKVWQRAKGLEPTGKVDRKTWASFRIAPSARPS
jgi:peptidoglycan hydrolase-like protein with peptidoglycan-binding domain